MNPAATPKIELLSTSVEQTQQFGAELGRLVESGNVIALKGDLGAGKTNFTQGLARGMGITEDVNSPTFILANEYYGGRLPLYHVDAYRVENAVEADGFGLDDYLNGDGVTVIEWAERVRDALPRDVLWIELEYRDETTRALAFNPTGSRAARLLENSLPLFSSKVAP